MQLKKVLMPIMLAAVFAVASAGISNTQAQFYDNGSDVIENSTGLSENTNNAEIVLLSQNLKKSSYGWRDLVGQVKNIGNESAQSIQIGLNVYKDGEVVATASGSAEADTLRPGQKTSFTIMTESKDFKGMDNYELSLEWYDPDYDAPEYVENAQIYKDNSTKRVDSNDGE